MPEQMPIPALAASLAVSYALHDAAFGVGCLRSPRVPLDMSHRPPKASNTTRRLSPPGARMLFEFKSGRPLFKALRWLEEQSLSALRRKLAVLGQGKPTGCASSPGQGKLSSMHIALPCARLRPNPSFERTSYGLRPPAAPQVKR